MPLLDPVTKVGLMARHPNRGRFDLAAYDRNGQRTLLVEVKHRSADTRWAAEYRHNLIRGGFLSGSSIGCCCRVGCVQV